MGLRGTSCMAPRPAASHRNTVIGCCALGLPPRIVLLTLIDPLGSTTSYRRPTDETLTTRSDAMASNSFNSNNAKADLAYARALLRDGLVPSFSKMIQKPAYAFRRVPHNSCRAAANPIWCCSSANANVMRVIDHAQNPVAPGEDEIDEPDPGAGASRASGRSASRIPLCY